MAILYYTGGSSGGYDYTTAAAFWADVDADSADTWVCTWQLNEVVNSAYLSVTVSNANNQPHELTALASVTHDFTLTSGARLVTGTTAVTIDVRTNSIKFSNLIFSQTGTVSANRMYVGADDITFTNCIFRSAGGTYAVCTHGGDGNGTINYIQCGIVQASPSCFQCITESDPTGTTNLNYCSLLTVGTTAGGNMVGGDASWGTINVNNTKALSPSANGAGRKCFSATGGTMNGDYLSSSDDTASDIATTAHDNEAETDHYTNVTSGSEDLSIKTGGFTLSDFYGDNSIAGTFDAQGDERVADYCDIGCDQVSTAPAATTDGGRAYSLGYSDLGDFGRLGT